MQETLNALRGLQEIDRHIFRVQDELRRLPVELATRAEHLAAAAHEISMRKHELVEIRGDLKEIEGATSAQRMRLRKLEHECASGKVDAATQAAYGHEIRTVKRTISDAEDESLKLMERVEIVERELASSQARHTEEETVFAEFERNVQRELADATMRLAELEKTRAKNAVDGVDPAALATYKRVLAQRGGEALAYLDGTVCQGCHVEIPRNLAVRLARGTELVQCPSCSRILYV